MASENNGPPLLQPLPRRPADWQSSPADAAQASSHLLDAPLSRHPSDSTRPYASRSHSILNLTASTLFGIYAPTGSREDGSPPATPWGTGAETPSRHASIDMDRPAPVSSSRGLKEDLASLEARLLATSGRGPRITGEGGMQNHRQLRRQPLKPGKAIILSAFSRVITLFLFGLAYGGLIAHLHDHRNLSPVKIEAFDRSSWAYLAFWGTAGVALGNLLPWIDSKWQSEQVSALSAKKTTTSKGSVVQKSRALQVSWNDVVRSVGAFVGVAFAIRKLPWSSPLQLASTLALTNPFLWYLLDRTVAGFTLSSLIGILGTAALFAVNPSVVTSLNPLPVATNNTAPVSPGNERTQLYNDQTMLSHEMIGVATWIASVLFCSCVCFGNIGRLLMSRLQE